MAMGRHSRGRLFKECVTWKGEIRTLWKEVGEVTGIGVQPHKEEKGLRVSC